MKSDKFLPLQTSSILVVVPAFNEEESIALVIRDLRENGLNFVVVSDGSTDRTVTVCEELGAKVLKIPVNLGVGVALRVGFKYALVNGFDAVVQVDADGQHPIESVAELMISMNVSKSHLVVGSRFYSDANQYEVDINRKFAMSTLSKLASHACRTKISDSTSGFRLIRRPLLDVLAINMSSNYLGDTFETLVASGRSGFKVSEIPVNMSYRKFGVSSASSPVAIKYILKGLLTMIFRLHWKVRTT
jgi:glycosyltransferase involved in cell wall biosynthesis